jgi:Fe-Mn family superoxide dismutase
MFRLLFLLCATCACFAVERKSRPYLSESSQFEPYQSKDFSYLLGMGGLSDDLLKMHFQLYEGYVKNVNLVLQKLKSLTRSNRASSYEFGAFKRRLGWEFDGMRLHELYFSNLGGRSGPGEKMSIYQAIEKQFGSFDLWKRDFLATGAIRGIGWVILIRDPKEDRLINLWINEHDLGHLAGCEPLLVMDVWEHAYLTEYGLDRKKYMEVFLEKVNWDVVQERFSQSLKPNKTLTALCPCIEGVYKATNPHFVDNF